MSYRLGIDLGTTFTAAAVEEGGRVEVVQLGDHAPQIPSAVFVREDGELLVGEAAIRRGAVQPDRLAREFKRRLGDRVPLVLGGQELTAEQLTARLLQAVVTEVRQRQGRPPDRIALTHPANWGAHRREVFLSAVRAAGVGSVTTLTEPAAAAVHYSSTERADTGDIVAVYDLGGGTFDAAVLRKAAREFELLGTPEGVAELGGVDFDDMVFRHVLRALEGTLDGLDPEDPAVLSALVRLRRECTEAKEALSTDAETTVPVALPGLPATGVRLTRAEFEDMIRADVDRTVGCMRRALASASVTPEHVRTVVLVGGSARIPLVAEALGSEFGRPLTVSTQPKMAVALGAALLAGGVLPPPPDGGGHDQPDETTDGEDRGSGREPGGGSPLAGTGRRPMVARLAAAIAGLLLLAAVLAFVVPVRPGAAEPDGLPDGTEVTATVFGLPLPEVDVQGGGLRVSGPAAVLGAGPLRLTYQGSDGQPGTGFVRREADLDVMVRFAPLLLGLFAFAYAEADLRKVRRRRRARRGEIAAMAGIGAVVGLALLLTSWAWLDSAVRGWEAAVVLLACAAAGALSAPLQAAVLTARGTGRPTGSR
ncbi:Hsp70 family protein [Geodermatophilus sp. SYSU D00703]